MSRKRRELLHLEEADFETLPQIVGKPVYFTVMLDGEIKVWPKTDTKRIVLEISYQ